MLRGGANFLKSHTACAGERRSAAPIGIMSFCRQVSAFAALVIALLLPRDARAVMLQQSFVFDSAGGCQVHYAWSVPKECMGVMGAVRDCFAPGTPVWMDVAAAKRHFASFPALRVLGASRSDSGANVALRLAVGAAEARAAFSSGAFGAFSLAPSASAIGDMEFRAALPALRGDARPRRELISELAGGVDLRIVVLVPTGVIETTGQKVRFNQVQWHISSDDYLRGDMPEIFLRW